MTTPIFDLLKLAHGFDPLEDVEYESVMAWGEAEPVAEVRVRPNPEFPVYKVGKDEFDYWAVLRGRWVGDSFFVYQPHARLATWGDATAYAALLNGATP